VQRADCGGDIRDRGDCRQVEFGDSRSRGALSGVVGGRDARIFGRGAIVSHSRVSIGASLGVAGLRSAWCNRRNFFPVFRQARGLAADVAEALAGLDGIRAARHSGTHPGSDGAVAAAGAGSGLRRDGPIDARAVRVAISGGSGGGKSAGDVLFVFERSAWRNVRANFVHRSDAGRSGGRAGASFLSVAHGKRGGVRAGGHGNAVRGLFACADDVSVHGAGGKRDYSIILPVMISNTIAYLISLKYQRVPIFDLLSKQDGLDLPSLEEVREEEPLRVEDAMRAAVAPPVRTDRTMGQVHEEIERSAQEWVLLLDKRSGWH